MSIHLTDSEVSVAGAIREAIEQRIPGASAQVAGRGGHFQIEVSSSVFAGKGMLESHRLVYSAITHLMAGASPPVHAIDSLKTLTPAV